jgi:hypothetical protein
VTQNAQILQYLQRGRAISPLVALDRFQCLRLAARVRELRDQGVKIKTTMTRVGRHKLVASYKLTG